MLGLESSEPVNDTHKPVVSTQKLSTDQITARTTHESNFSRSLTFAVSQLAKREANTISSLVRKNFTQNQVLALIQIVRQQLFWSGHTQVVGPVKNAPNNYDHSAGENDLGIQNIVRLLCGCMDATGPMASFLQSDPEDFMEIIIPDLRSEIARALEAMGDAVALQGTLREMLRFADSARRASQADASFIRDATTLREPGSGAIVTLHREPDLERGDSETIQGILPLSLRANLVSPSKRRKGGGQLLQRSTRERLAMQSRQLGRYSLERLVL